MTDVDVIYERFHGELEKLRAEIGGKIDTMAATRTGELDRLCDKAGIDRHMTPHSLRRSAIQALLDSGVPLRDVQRYAGHKDPATTMAYDRRAGSHDRDPVYVISREIS